MRSHSSDAPRRSGLQVAHPPGLRYGPEAAAKGAGAHWSESLLLRAAVLSAWLLSSVNLALLNKWLLSSGKGNFPFPLLLCMAQQGFAFLALSPIMLTQQYREAHAASLGKQWPGLLALASAFAVNTASNTASLVTIPLSLNQIIR